MTFSLGLALYTLRHRTADGPPPVRSPRPEGPLVWLHAPTADSLRPMLALARRLVAARVAQILLTAPEPPAPMAGITSEPPPPDTPADARAFLDHWQPGVAVLSEGDLRPALVDLAQTRNIATLMVDAREARLPKGLRGWWPGLVGHLLGRFHAVLAVDESAARALRRAGAPARALTVAGRMEQPSAALPCNEAERAALAHAVTTRPIWLAASVPETEETQVIEAHRSVLRLAHRMLLIVVPEDPSRAALIANRMERVEGWTVARRAADEEPDPDAQVYIADSAAEYGLWFRLAPVTYLGGSLTPGGCRIDPAQPAALGSAIVHGPRSGAHGALLGRLAAAQGAALVGSASDLADTLGELLAPDRAARLAQAAWAVTSEGADVTDRVVGLITGLLAAGPAPSSSAGRAATSRSGALPMPSD